MMGIPTPLALVLGSALICAFTTMVVPDAFPNTKLTTMFFITTGISFFVYAIWKMFIYPPFFSPLRHIPQPKTGAVPVIGYPAITIRRSPGDTFLRFIQEVPNESIIRFPGLFNADCLYLADPSSLAEVLVHKSYDFEKPQEIRGFLRIILGDGLVLVEGDEHRFQRKHVSPAFSFRHIKELYPAIWIKAISLTDRVATELSTSGKDTIEINHWANKVTMDIIGVAGLGREFNSINTDDDELVKNYEELLEPTAEKAAYFAVNLLLPRSIVTKLPWKLNKSLADTTATLRTICRQLVREKREVASLEKEKRVNILSLLIESNSFGDDMLIDQLLTFLAAGHETTSSAFTWATYLLAKHPSIQNRLRTEIRSALPSPSTPLDPSLDLSTIIESLPTLHGVCNETLRLFPPVPTTTRIAVRDTTILNHAIPKGTRMFLSPWATNRSPALWGPSAAEFVPERWVDEQTGKPNNIGGVKSNYSNLTFLHGPRSCIGERFARAELKILVVLFVGLFEIGMEDESEVPVPAGAITLKPRDGMHLRLKPLGGW